MNPPDRQSLYTARWHLMHDEPVPAGPIRDAVLALMEPVIGRAPGAPAPSTPPPVPSTALIPFQNADHPPVKDVVWLVPPGKSFPIVGVGFTLAEFRGYLETIDPDRLGWSPVGVTVHHTAAPSLAQRPNGFETQHMRNLRSYYQSLGWDRGPHLFVDDHRIWVFSPLTARGIHAVSFNGTRFGIEMLGDYDSEDPKLGRGAAVTALGAAAACELVSRFDLTSPTNFHRDDPKTSKTCPGKKIEKAWFLELMSDYTKRRQP